MLKLLFVMIYYTKMNERIKLENEVQSLLNVLNFTTKILYPKYPQTLFPLLSKLFVIYQYQKKIGSSFTVRSVPTDVIKYLLSSVEQEDDNYSSDNCVLVSCNSLKMLGRTSGSWVKMKILHRKHIRSERHYYELQDRDSYLVEIRSLSGLEDGIVITSDIMFYNLKEVFLHKEPEEMQVIFEKIVKSSGKESTSENQFIPFIATDAKVALIQTPYDINSEMLNSVLHLYFSIPRYVAVHDIFSIHIKDYGDLEVKSVSNQNVKDLYFVVTEITGPDYGDILSEKDRCGYFISKDITKLIQVNNKKSFIPRTTQCVVKNINGFAAENYNSFLYELCPTGLKSQFSQLIESINPFLFAHEQVKIKPMFLLFGPQGVGKKKIVKCIAHALGLHLVSTNCLFLQSSIPGYAEGKLKAMFHKAQKNTPCILLMVNIEAVCKDKDGDEDSRAISAFYNEISKLFSHKNLTEGSSHSIILIATCDTNKDMPSAVPPPVARMFLHTMYISSPNEKQRLDILEWLIKRDTLSLHKDVSLPSIASRSSGFLYADLVALVSHALRNCYKHVKLSRKYVSSAKEETADLYKIAMRKIDFDYALDTMHAAHADAIGAPKIPSVSWNDVGGLSVLKEEILRTITLPLKHPELSASGLRRSGILLYGPPGTGKTLLAKAVATECSLNFLSVKGPELLNMYVGQSEENVRDVFQRARSSSPCIIFFDELDSLAPNRGRSGDSGGVMDRVVSQLLAEMDGLQKCSHLFVIGATNRPDLIDPALLRPGRFDKLLYVGVCEDKNAQLSVMCALTRKFHLKNDVDLSSVVSLLPNNMTGADMYSLCSNAWMHAVKSHIKRHRENGDPLPIEIEVGTTNFEAALSCVHPSLSQEEMHYFTNIHKEMKNH